MWKDEYIKEVLRKLVIDYGLEENPDKPGFPRELLDGEYPMTIQGKVDMIRIEKGEIKCCNFADEK
jgi:hypothetical protein